MGANFRDKDVHNCSAASAVYGMGAVGAAVYYISTADGFWDGVLGFLMAPLWPGFVVYEVMKSLGM